MLQVFDLDLIDHAVAMSRQKSLLPEIASGEDDALLLCEHPPTITFGRKFKDVNLFVSRGDLIGQGFVLSEVDRGGDVTLHAPGQLVLYPLINLKRQDIGLREYLQKLEKVAVDLLGDFDIVAEGDDGNRGVWIGRRKIASIGIGVSRWVTYHGMGLNIRTDLSLFSRIRPCGLDVKMTSLKAELGCDVNMADIKSRVIIHFQKVFGY